MTKRILVCEDEDAIREFVVINLKRAGYDVVDVPNGEEALRVYEERRGEFGLALLDIMMRGWSWGRMTTSPSPSPPWNWWPGWTRCSAG